MPTLAAGIDIAAPTLATACAALPPKGARFALGRPGGKTAPTRATAGGFTLLELMVVVAIMALATAGVALSLRDGSVTALERDAQRLGALLESGRAQSRMNASPVRWRNTDTGFVFEGTTTPLPNTWLSSDVRAEAATIVLGPEPIIGPQKIQLISISSPQHRLTLATDGVRPFAVRSTAADDAP